MAEKKRKWYVVWQGHRPGVYDEWAECLHQTDGYSGAKFRAFPTKDAALEAFEAGYEAFHKDPANYLEAGGARGLSSDSKAIRESLSVDAACSGNPGLMEYRGVLTWSKAEVFHLGPFEQGTNNIGEFLALVHGMSFLMKINRPIPIYSDSITAMAWVRQKRCKTLLLPSQKNAPLFELIKRAENWLKVNDYPAPLLKWNTKAWGEIPADFGRK